MKNWRIYLVLSFCILFGAGILAKLFFLQALNGSYYKALAQGQIFYNLEESIRDQRGEIFFADGEPLAINVEWPLVSLCPREIKEKEATAKALAQALQLDEGVILEKSKSNDLYAIVKKRISEEEVAKIKDLKLKGVYLKKEAGRYYPQETLASQLVGFLNAEKVGQYGLEGAYNETLKEEGERNDLALTIDYSIQFTAEKLLEDAQKDLKIEGGEIIVMDPASGKVLALANFPNFNPNQYSKVTDLEIFQNVSTQKIYEPGSIFKPITMAAAIDKGVLTPSTTYEDPGRIDIGGWPIYNYEQRVYPGKLTMTTVLEKSINTGAVFAEQKLGHNNFLNYAEDFGIFSPSGIDLKEVYSDNKELKKGYEVNYATAAFGQGIEMTPIQVIKAYTAFTNGGKIVEPYVVEKIVRSDGEIEYPERKEALSVISASAASQITAMMVSVTENGYGKAASVPNYYIAGKTGTAQVSYSSLGINKKGYSDKTWQSFVGFGPAFDPKFLILIKLDNPQSKTAEFSAVPMFKKLAKYIIDYYQIPPDH